MKYRVVRTMQVFFEFEVEAESPEKAAELCEGMIDDPSLTLDHPEAHGGSREQATTTDQYVHVYDPNDPNEEPLYEDP